MRKIRIMEITPLRVDESGIHIMLAYPDGSRKVTRCHVGDTLTFDVFASDIEEMAKMEKQSETIARDAIMRAKESSRLL